MVDSRKRASASLKVKYKSTTLSQFISQFGLDISHAGMFIKTKTPLEPGALIRLELQLSDGTPVIVGSGRVRWRRAAAAESQAPAGMGIEFTRLDPESRRFVDSLVDGREGRPSRYEQTDGAEHAPSSALISASPPASTQAPDPTPTTAAPASAASQPEPPQAATPPPTPQPLAARASVPPNAPVLFAGSRLGGSAATDPFLEAPTQSSFFQSRVAGAAPARVSQSPFRAAGARDSSVTPIPTPRRDPGDKLVDQLFADAIPTSDPSDDLITSEFPGPDLGRDNDAVSATGVTPAAALPEDSLRDPPPPLPRPASLRSPDLVLKAPSQFPSPLTDGASGFPGPARSRALLVSAVALLGLLATAAVYYLL